jgi:hypothetical protein
MKISVIALYVLMSAAAKTESFRETGDIHIATGAGARTQFRAGTIERRGEATFSAGRHC